MKIPKEQMLLVADRARRLRLHNRLSQRLLAEKSGVSLGSLKRFEHTGKIALESLLKLALVLNALDDFDFLFMSANDIDYSHHSIDQLVELDEQPQRGAKMRRELP